MFEHALPFTLDVVTLGVKDFARSVRFYGTLGLAAEDARDRR